MASKRASAESRASAPADAATPRATSLSPQIKILRKLRHPHIVNLKEVVTTDAYTYIIMEL